MNASVDNDWPFRNQPYLKGVVLVLLVLAFGTLISLYAGSLSYFRLQEEQRAENRLSLYGRSLDETIERFQHLPFMLARDPFITNFQPENLAALNQRLAQFAEASQLEAIYLMDQSGTVIAASNFQQQTSFLGQNYGFRPYFQAGLDGRRGQYFGVGATTGRPGFFLSEPVIAANGDIAAVIAIKLDMSELQNSFEQSDEHLFVSDANGIVVLASDRHWLYQAINPLDKAAQETIRQSRQFGTIKISTLNWSAGPDLRAVVAEKPFIYVSAPANQLSWRVHYLLEETRMREQAIFVTGVLAMVWLVLFGLVTFYWSSRTRLALSAAQKSRAELQRSNSDLRLAQKKLAQTSKLAALGQLAASVTHELGQPISALRNHITAAEISGELKNGRLARHLSRVVDRMENLTGQLRVFSKSGEDAMAPTDLRVTVDDALSLTQHSLDQAHIQLKWVRPESAHYVWGNRMRLEQVLVNLIKNAILAMENVDPRILEITLTQRDDHYRVAVTDTGHGVKGRDIKVMQEPFYTTRASGEGMGLGLAISTDIVADHNGEMNVSDRPMGGAIFNVDLPIYLESAHDG